MAENARQMAVYVTYTDISPKNFSSSPPIKAFEGRLLRGSSHAQALNFGLGSVILANAGIQVS